MALGTFFLIATCILWGRSRFASDDFYLENWRWAVGAGLRLDHIYLWQATVQSPVPRERQFGWTLKHDSDPPHGGIVQPPKMQRVRFCGAVYQFGIGTENERYSYYHRDLFLPWWLVMAGSVLPVAAALAAAWLRRRGAIPCRFCGYDLRARPDKCPECGNAPGVSGFR